MTATLAAFEVGQKTKYAGSTWLVVEKTASTAVLTSLNGRVRLTVRLTAPAEEVAA
jgi:hypothetical protein